MHSQGTRTAESFHGRCRCACACVCVCVCVFACAYTYAVCICVCVCHRTPCVNRIYDALPPESRVGRVQLLVPGDGAPHTAQPPACAIHLAATGDQGFGRRLRLAFPLLKQVRAYPYTHASQLQQRDCMSFAPHVRASCLAYLCCKRRSMPACVCVCVCVCTGCVFTGTRVPILWQ